MLRAWRFVKALVGLAPVASALTPASVARTIERIEARYDDLLEAEHQLHDDIQIARMSRLSEIEALRQEMRELWDHQQGLLPRPAEQS